MHYKSKTNRTIFNIAAAGFLIAASSDALAEGDGNHEHDEPDGQAWTALEIGQPGLAEEVERTVSITMADNYFEPEEIDVRQGETVRFIVTNEGTFVHEFNIGTAARHAKHQDEMMMMVDHGVLEVDKINHHMMSMTMEGGMTMSHDHANSVLLEPGETAEVIWAFTGDTALEFACNVPGHYDAGMMGEIVLDDAPLAQNQTD